MPKSPKDKTKTDLPDPAEVSVRDDDLEESWDGVAEAAAEPTEETASPDRQSEKPDIASRRAEVEERKRLSREKNRALERRVFGVQLLAATRDGDEETVERLIGRRADVNLRDPDTGATALHYAAAYNAQFCLTLLLQSGECNHLVRDKRGMYPSEVAYEFGNNPEIGGILAEHEARQAQEEGIDLYPKPQSNE